MYWLILFAIAITLAGLGKRLASVDEVYALALYIAGLFSSLGGLVLAPTSAQITLGVLALGWLQASAIRS